MGLNSQNNQTQNNQEKLNEEIQQNTNSYKQNFLKLVEKEKNINEEKEFFEKIEIYEENLKIFLKDLENKKLKILLEENGIKLIIKGDNFNAFNISEKYKEENETLKNIFEEYKIIAEKLKIKEYNDLSFLGHHNILKIIENKNKNFLEKFISEENLKSFLGGNFKIFFENYEFFEKEYGFTYNPETLDLNTYIENYNFLKDKLDIDKKILELFQNGYDKFQIKIIFSKNISENLKKEIKNILIKNEDFKNIYENIGYFLPLDENLLLGLKNFLLKKLQNEIFFIPNEDKTFFQEKINLIKSIFKNLKKEEFSLILKNKACINEEKIIKIYLEENKNEVKNILQYIHDENLLEKFTIGDIYLKNFLEEYNVKLDYKRKIDFLNFYEYEKYFDDFFTNKNIKKFLLEKDTFVEDDDYKDNIFFSEYDEEVLEKIIKTFSKNIFYLEYFFKNLIDKNYENIENVLKNEKILDLFEKIFEEIKLKHSYNGLNKITKILGKDNLNEEKLEKILEKIIFIKNNKYFDELINENKEIAILSIFDKEIYDLDKFLLGIINGEFSLKNLETDLKGDDYINLLKEEKQKEEILKKLRKNDNFFYEIFKDSLIDEIKNLNLENTKKLLENFNKKIEEINKNYEEQLIITIFNKLNNNYISKFNFLRFSKKIKDIETFEKKLQIYKILENSKSYEVKKLAENIFEQISELENPEEFIEKIEKIFLENKLPYTAKIFKIFSLLYDEDKINDKISEISSPYLQKLKEKGKSEIIYSTFFKDLLKTHIFSGNRDLKNFLKDFEKAKDIFKKENLEKEEKEFLYEIVLVLGSLAENKDFKNNLEVKDFGDLEKNISELLEKLNLKDISEIFEYFENNFLKTIGFENTKEVLDFMEKNISEKNKKSKNFGNFKIEKNDLVKGFDSNFYHLIGNEGFVSREFLGVEGDSDRTPFDLDLIKIENETFEEIINNSTASSFGNTFAVVKSGKNEIFESDLQNTKSYKNHDFELFKTGVLGENHFGIRTGLPSTSIDFFVHKSKNTEETLNFFYSITKSGIFIPVLDENKNVIFSFEDFQNFRKIFASVKNFSDENIFVERKNENPLFLSETIKNYPKKEEFEEIENLTKNIYDELENILKNLGIEKRKNKEKVGYEIQSTGSTGRNTFLPNSNFDFDLNIKLDEESYKKVRENLDKFLDIFDNKNSLQNLENTDYNGESLSIQFLKGEKDILGKKVEIDLLFSKLTNDNIYDTNKVLEEKLENIRKNSEEDYNFVIANIRSAKKFFKENGIYKKGDGGLGGVGIEFWILNNEGSFEKAVKSFLENALDENNEFINYSDFKKKYHIYSAGENIKGKENDKIENFIFKIGENGYFKICEILKNMIK